VIRDPDSRPPEATFEGRALLARRLEWLTAIRLAVMTSFAVASLLMHLGGAGPDPNFLYALAGATYLATLLYLGMMRWLPERLGLVLGAQIAGDLLLTSGLVYYFGGVNSPASAFYLLVLIVAAFLHPERGTTITASAAWALYLLVVLAVQRGWVSPPGVLGSHEVPLWRLTYNLVAHGIGFYVVAHLTSLLARQVRRTESELAARKADLEQLQVVHRDVVASVPSGLVTCDLDGRVTSANPAALAILDRDAEAVLGQPVTATRLISADLWERLVEGSESLPGRLDTEIEVGGRSRSIGFTVSMLTSAADAPNGYILIFQDLTERLELERALRLKDRMAAVGEMAAGIAHEIGNPLAALSGSVQMLSGTVGSDPGARPLLDIILKESQRLDRTIKGFLRFARSRDRVSAPFDIAALLTETMELLRNSPEVGPHHELRLEVDPPSLHIDADSDLVAQVFWNLARNALRAMPDGGTFTVRGTLAGSRYRIAFRDTGRGMTDEQRARIFQPFQSFFDQGSGIGLAIVYRIVQEHEGEISVESEPGKGTEIRVDLPVTVPANAIVS
jgi:two-component system sensor histidine kinase PilS (NtrC family)